MYRQTLLMTCALAGLPGLAQAAETYVVEPTHTFARFSYDHMGYSTFRARFDTTSGEITLDTAKKTGSVDITIDAASISTGVPKFNDHLKSAEFFDVAKYPTITFKATDLKFDGDKLASVTGTLDLHGVQKPLTLTVTRFHCAPHPMTKAPACGADATGTLKRSDFGLGLYAPLVGDEVTLMIEVEAHLKK
jgi:polyisoprenoid-binding protein YceI